MTTLVLPPRYTPDSITLSKAANRKGWDVCRFASWRVPEGFSAEKIVLYGEPLFASVVVDALGVVALEPSWDWLPSLPERYRLRKVVRSSLGKARGLAQKLFVKPLEDKCFAAKVYECGNDLPPVSHLPDSTPILISDPVDWRIEFRTFVLDRQVRTLSPYLRDGELAEDKNGQWPATAEELEAATIFAKQVLTDPEVQMPRAFVLDIGRIEGRGWAVIEANAAWGAGIYGCDPDEVINVLESATARTIDLSDQDKKWVVR
ncbi:MAG: ATP-grasp domain-containing protein [Phycisphaerae bacterium]